MTQVIDLAWVSTTRPAEWPEAVSIAELAVFIDVDPKALPTVASSIDNAIRSEYAYEVVYDDRNELDWKSGFIVFRDGSTLEFKVNK